MRDDVCTGSSRHTLRMSAGRVVHGPTVAGGREASYVCRTRSTASSIDSLLQPMTARGRGSGDLCKFPDVVQDSHLCQWLVPALGGASAWGTVPGPVAVTEPGASDLLRSATTVSQSTAPAHAARTLVYSSPVVTGCHNTHQVRGSDVRSHLVYVGVMGSLFWYEWRLGSFYRGKHDYDKYVCKYAPPFSFCFPLFFSIQK